jgi:ubiquinone/menaquinone biosynthesis C-methylase UbiE
MAALFFGKLISSMTPERNPTRKTYDQFAEQIAERLWNADVVELCNAFCDLLPPHASILDVGCGPGRDSAHFNSLGHLSVGMDISIGMLREAAQRTDGNYVQGDMTVLPFAPASFDAAWMSASLLHIPRSSATDVLAQVYTILESGGVLFIALKKGEGEVWEEREGLRFFTFYQEEEITGLLKKARFDIIKQWTNATPKQEWINVLARKV